MQRIIIVSNRLPFTVEKENGEWKFKESVGGLATGLRAYLGNARDQSTKERDYIWVGWPGSTIPDPFKDEVSARALSEHHSYPARVSQGHAVAGGAIFI